MSFVQKAAAPALSKPDVESTVTVTSVVATSLALLTAVSAAIVGPNSSARAIGVFPPPFLNARNASRSASAPA